MDTEMKWMKLYKDEMDYRRARRECLEKMGKKGMKKAKEYPHIAYEEWCKEMFGGEDEEESEDED